VGTNLKHLERLESRSVRRAHVGIRDQRSGYHRGVGERPLPWIPIAIGVVVGALLAFGNCLIGLKTGLWDTAQLTSTLLTFVLCARLLS
jgi:hypothetical protein